MSGKAVSHCERTKAELTAILASIPPIPPVVNLCVPPGFTGLVTFELINGEITKRTAMVTPEDVTSLESYLNIARLAGWVVTPPEVVAETSSAAQTTRG